MATATAPPSSGPRKAPGVTAPLCARNPPIAAQAVTATAAMPQRGRSRCSSRKYSGKAIHSPSGDTASSATHTAPTAASHTAAARAERPTTGVSTPATYTAASSPQTATTHPARGAESATARPAASARSPNSSACRHSRRTRETGVGGRGAAREASRGVAREGERRQTWPDQRKSAAGAPGQPKV